jgi:ATP-binding cassette, subfamily B, bacterial
MLIVMSAVTTWLKETKHFALTIQRVLLINWRVSPPLYVLQVVMTVIQGLLPLASAWLTAQLLGRIAEQIMNPSLSLVPIWWILGTMAGIQFVISQTSYWSFYLDDKFGMQFDIYVQRNLFEHVHSLDQSYYEDPAFNNQLNKITQNLYSMRSLNRNFLMAGNSLVQLLSTAIALVAFEPLIALVISVALIPILAVEVQTSLKRWRSWDQRGTDWRLQWYLRNLLTDVVNLREIKLYNLKNYLLGRWQGHLTSARQAELAIERRAQRLRAFTSLLDILITYGSQVWLLLRVLQRGSGLDAFVFYRQVIENYANAGSSLVRNLHTMQENSLYVNDYFSLLALKPRLTQPARSHRLPAGRSPRIEFEQVWFRYPGSEQDVLQDISFTIEPGKDLAIVGANGAGKTTLIKLLLRFYDPTKGRILIDGTDLRKLNLTDWYGRVGALFQDFNKYSSLTVRNNIEMGRIDRAGDNRELAAAVEQSGAERFIQDYPKMFDQVLNRSYKDGVEPSGGQWQRIALARAFFRQAEVLILDEPTSAIDAAGEFEIFEQITKTQADKTTIIISHRFSTVRNAGQIIVLENGRVTEQGSHEELVALDGRYKELFELQASGYR